jgi:hypothetical protein
MKVKNLVVMSLLSGKEVEVGIRNLANLFVISLHLNGSLVPPTLITSTIPFLTTLLYIGGNFRCIENVKTEHARSISF